MTDFESRVRDTLQQAAGDAPGADGLAGSAHRRLRTRRRRVATALAAAALVVVAVPLALAVAGSDSGRNASDPEDVSESPPGWRPESWRDLQLVVPPDWGYGSMTAWCASGGRPAPPVVDRQEDPVPMIACPYVGYGAQFFEPGGVDDPTRDLDSPAGEVGQPGDGYPDGAWVGYATTGHAGVLVVAPGKDTAQEVLDSAEPIDVADRNGCVTGVYASTDFRLDDDPGGRLTVCRYTGSRHGPDEPGYWLAQSTRLGATDSAAVRDAIAAAPVGKTAFRPCEGRSEFFLLTTRSGDVPAWIYNGGCGEQGVLTVDGESIVDSKVTDELLSLLGSPYGLIRD